MNLLDNTPNQLSKFRTKNWIEINDQSRRVYDVNSDIRFKTSMLQSRLRDYRDAYILLKEEYQLLEKETVQQKNKQMKEIRD